MVTLAFCKRSGSPIVPFSRMLSMCRVLLSAVPRRSSLRVAYTSSWGNWQYQAGVGNDARASRQFNPIKQAADYDPDN